MGYMASSTIVARAAQGEVLYRLVRADRAHAGDFRSHRERPRRRPIHVSTPWLLTVGVSMFDSYEGALQVARRRPAWIAELSLVGGWGIHVAITGPFGHRTVWGDPDALTACVQACHLAPLL
jgi:hypothetical protein